MRAPALPLAVATTVGGALHHCTTATCRPNVARVGRLFAAACRNPVPSADVVAAVVKRANNLKVEKHEKDDNNTHISKQGLRIMNSDGSITLHETATRC
jgi:hypothetical protein